MTHATSPLLRQPIEAPYPGLRPFQPHESAIFFGRDEHVADMLTVLEDHRFLAVVGPSGGGKSSLVLAGLIPALERSELLTARSDDWRFVILRPGDAPYRNFADAAQRCLWPGDKSHQFHDGDAGLTELVLRSSPFGFVEALRDAAIPDNANVLLLVDQFEELFRFRAPESASGETAAKRRDDAATFLQLLLETAKQTRRPVYVMLTMRSDFLGDCDVFDGLPQAINQSQYLTPRLNMTQLSDAIVRPLQAARFQGHVAPALVQRILNDIGTARDELPIVQHALFRTWQKAKELRQGDAVELTLSDYDAVGGLRSALSLHANEALTECKQHGLARVVEKVFRGLSMRGTDGQQIRRPATMQQLADESGVSTDEVKSVVEAFRRNDRCFLMPPVERGLTPATKVDISHEAIIRQWHTLNGEWFRREDDSRRRLLRVVEDAEKHALRRGDLLAGVELDDVEQWWHDEQPTAAWVRRYVDARPLSSLRGSRAADVIVDTHAAVREFITLSRTEQTRREREAEEEARQAQEAETRRRLAEAKAEAEARRGRSLRNLLSVVAVVAVAAVGLGGWAIREKRRAFESEKLARYNAKKANRESSRAFSQIANDAREKGDSIKATHSFLHVAKSLDKANAPDAEQNNVLLAAQFASGNIIQTIPQFGSSVVSNRDNSRMLAWGYGSAIELWELTTKSNRPIRTFRPQSFAKINGAQFNADESRVLTWADDGEVRIWDVTKDQSIQSFRHDAAVLGAQFSRDESRVLSWSADGTARVWDVSRTEMLREFKHNHIIFGAQFNRDASRVLTWSHDNTAQVWDVTNGEPLRTLRHSAPVLGAVFSRDESRVLSWGEDSTALMWDLTKPEPLQTFRHDGFVNGAQFIRDESGVLTWSDDGTARVWDTASGQSQGEPLRHGRVVVGARLSRDESRLLIWGGDRTCLWDVDKDVLIGTWLHEGSVFSAKFNHDESLVLTWSADKKARIWNISEVRPMQVLGHGSVIRGAQFTNSDKEVLTWSADGDLKRWHSQHPRLRHTFQQKAPINGAVLNDDARRLLLWTFDAAGDVANSYIALWDMSSQDHPKPLPFKQTKDVQGALLSRDGSRCLAWMYNALGAANFEMVLWNVNDSAVATPFDLPKSELAVLGASWSFDESRLLTWGADGVATLWRLPDAKQLRQFMHDRIASERRQTIEGVQSVTIPIIDRVIGAILSNDGKTVITWSEDRTIRFWDADSGKETKRFSHDARVNGARLSRDESLILTWTGGDGPSAFGAMNQFSKTVDRGEVWLWSLSKSEPVLRVAHDAAVNGAWISQDQERLLTYSDDGTAVLWEITSGDKLQTFRHSDAVVGAKLLQHDSLVLTWSRDKTAALWDASTKLPLAVFNHDGPVTGALTNRDDSRMLTWSSGAAKWWDISLHDEHLTPRERMLEFEVRSATQLNSAGEIAPLSVSEWLRKRNEFEQSVGTRNRPDADR